MKRQYWMRFLAPDLGGSPGGTTQPAAPAVADPNEGFDPFNGIDPDLLEEPVRVRLTELGKQVKAQADLARKHQSEKDRAIHELQRLQSTPPQKSSAEPAEPDEYAVMEENMVKEFMQNGIPQANAQSLARVQMISIRSMEQGLIGKISKNFAPLAQTVNSNVTSAAFQEAVANDQLGVLQDEAVRNSVWTIINSMSENGQTVTADIVENLALIQFGKKQKAEAQGQGQAPYTPAPKPLPPQISTRLSFPGTIKPPIPGAVNSRPGAGTVSNAETASAIAATIALMSPKKKGR